MGFSLGEYQDIFLEEADEQLQELNQNLLQLEKDPNDSDIINNIFRAAHSLKSSAAFVGLNSLSDLAHKMENLLQGIRDKTMDVNPEIVSVLFRCFDEISSVIGTVASGEEPTQDLSSIISQIQQVHDKTIQGGGSPAAPKQTQAVRTQDVAVKTKLTVDEMKKIKKGLESGLSCCEVTVFVEQDAMMKFLKARLVVNNLEQFSTIVTTVPDLDEAGDRDVEVFRVVLLTEQPVDEIRKACDVDQVARVDLRKISLTRKDEKIVIRFHDTETIADVEGMQPQGTAQDNNEYEQEDEPERNGLFADEPQDNEEDHDIEHIDISSLSVDRKKDDKKAYIIKTVKVSVEKLDLLLNNVGELVIANSGFYKLYEEMRKLNYDKAVINEFKNRMEQMSRIAKDLQSSIMKTRMVPIGQVFSRFNRLVRDLAIEFDKKLQLKIIGEETELDKKVIDAIGEPLMHLIRNSIDHGVEKTEERRKMNKTEIATITLNAYQGGNQIFVEVSDDGRGLNLQGIKNAAVKRGVATREMLANMDNEDIYNMIFTPGFSTAEEITDISGRGVGMNVVKEIVTELNGNVSIETEPGMGTRFVMAFPLTLAIIPAIMVKVRNEMFAIPLSDVIETIKVSNEDVTTIEGHEVINLRGEILSLIRLNEFVKVESALGDDQKIPVVVVGFGNRKIGMMVDYLEGKQEIVIKSLEQNYRTVEGLAGASILGDGSICLILDIASMINKVIAEQDVVSRRDRKRVLEGKKIGLADEGVTVPSLDTTAKISSPQEEREVIHAPAVNEEISRPGKSAVSPRTETSAPKFEPKIEKKEAEKEKPEIAAVPDDSREEIKEEKIYDIHAEETSVISEDIEPAAALETAARAGSEVSDEDVEKRVKEALSQFKDELRENVKYAMGGDQPDEHIKKAMQMTDDDLDKVRVIANIGITEAAESLSKILNKQIDLSIPDVRFIAVENIPGTIGDVDNVYIGVYMPLVGDITGTILFSLMEEKGFELIDHLYGIESGRTNELTEDGESALKEVTNIIGSSVVNVFSDKIGMALKPTVPTIVHDYMQATLDSILVMYNVENDYALVMETDFFYGDDRVIGNLLILPDAESLKTIVSKLRD